MKPRRQGRQETAAAVHARPLVGLLLACALCGAAAEPVVNPALAPVDMSKLLQVPSSGNFSHEGGSSILRRTEVSLTPGTPFASVAGPNWNAALEVASAESDSDLKPRRRAQADATKPGRDSNPSPLRGSSMGAPQEDFDLFRDALRELHDTSEVKDLKEVWRDASAEISKFRGGFLFDAPTEEELAQRRQARPHEESILGGGTSFGSSSSGSGNEPLARPRSAAEQQRDSIVSAIMLRKLIDEITPWAIALILSMGLARVGLSFWRLQARRSQRSGLHGSSSRRVRSSRRRAG